MRERQATARAPGTIPRQTLSGHASRPKPPDPVGLRLHEALADLHQAWGAGQPVAREKRPGILAKALGFLNNLW